MKSNNTTNAPSEALQTKNKLEALYQTLNREVVVAIRGEHEQHIKVKPGYAYELLIQDGDVLRTDFEVSVKKVGNDLEVSIGGNDTTVIFDNYWEVCISDLSCLVFISHNSVYRVVESNFSTLADGSQIVHYYGDETALSDIDNDGIGGNKSIVPEENSNDVYPDDNGTNEVANFTLSSASYTTNENLPFIVPAPTITGTPIGTLTYKLIGADAELFNINSSGQITMAAQDFENPLDTNGDNIYNVTIVAKDSDSNVARGDHSVEVLDVPNITKYGTRRNDVLFGSGDYEYILYGDDGDDVLYGGDGGDKLYAYKYWQSTVYGVGNDILYGGGGNDELFGDNGDDELHGGEGNDLLRAYRGDDKLYGDEGDDVLWGSEGNDILYGGEGDDHLVGSEGDDELHGGEGYDRVSGGEDNDILYGDEGDDYLHGDEGNDELYGGEGVDILAGNEGDDTLYGEEGDDYLLGNDGNDTLHGNEGDDKLWGGEGNDLLIGGEGNDKLYSNEGDDTLHGNEGNDILHSGEGNDILYGGDGDDILVGVDGDDELYGGDGNDELWGDAGDNLLEGGAGKDTFKYDNMANGSDTITDFLTGAGIDADVLDLSALLIGYNPSSTLSITNFISFTDNGTDTTLDIDADGGATGAFSADVTIHLQNVTGVDLNTMIADDNIVLV